MMRQDAILTVVVPTLNSAATLDATLASLRTLPQRLIDLKVVDSGSTDDTVAICDRHGLTPSYCPPGNMYRAINQGIRSSSCAWCAYINSDDIVYPRAYLRMLQSAMDSNAEVLYAGADFIDSDGRYLHNMPPPPSVLLPWLFEAGTLPFAQPASMLKRSAFDRCGGFDESYKYSADYALFRACLLHELRFRRFSREPVAAFRLSPGQASLRFADQMRVERDRATSAGALRGAGVSYAAGLAWRAASLWTYIDRVARHHLLYGRFRLARRVAGASQQPKDIRND